jgi:hypothetical protein
MRAVLAAAEAGHNAYAGDGLLPDTTGALSDWRRFLDLVEEVGESDVAEALFKEWVVTATDADLLATRAAARDAYAELEAASDEWAVPQGIRANMALWRFAEATDLIDAAEPVIALREDLEAAAADLGLETPADVEAPFEAAALNADLGEVADTLEARIEAAGSIAATRDALAAERPPLVTLGLAGETPDAGYEAARTALSKGDVAGATAGAAATMALLAGAESVGTTRALMIGIVGLALLLVLLVALAIVLRRRRRGAVGVGAAAGASTTLAPSPGPGDALPAVPSTPIESAGGAEPD